MKTSSPTFRLLLGIVMVLFLLPSMAQQTFKLHVQPGKTEMKGDGDDYTTILVTARDKEGELLTNINGPVMLRISTGMIDETNLQMRGGMAYVKFTAPMLGTPVKASQRMVLFIVKFMQKFISRSAKSTDQVANTKLAQNIALETFKDGANPLTLITKSDKDNFVYIVAEMNGVKGKAKIQINKSTDGPNGSIIPGYYAGYDITGTAPFEMEINSNGSGTFSQPGSGNSGDNTILFTSEQSKEVNDAMGKLYGMGGFLKAYLGPSERDSKYIENYDIRKQGIETPYIPMPNNAVFIYVPPLLLEYKGRLVNPTSSKKSEPEEPKEKVFVSLSSEKIIGDGESRTKALFHFETSKGIPVAGKKVTWSYNKDLKLVSGQTVTDGSGNAVAEFQAPIAKAGDLTRSEVTNEIKDNSLLFTIKAQFAGEKGKADEVTAFLTVYKTYEAMVRILKPGFNPDPVKMLLPQADFYRLKGSIYATLTSFNKKTQPIKVPIYDAGVLIEGPKFDVNLYKIFREYSSSKREQFITLVKGAGGYLAYTDKGGNYDISVSLQPDKILKKEPVEINLSDLTGRRKGSLGNVLDQFKDSIFSDDMSAALLAMDKDLCSLNGDKALFTEEKLHILGNLMSNSNFVSVLLKDTGGELISKSWDAFKTLADFANEKYKITERLGKKVGVDSLVKMGLQIDKVLWDRLAGMQPREGTKTIIRKFLYEMLLGKVQGGNKGSAKATNAYYTLMGESASAVLSKIFEKLTEGISDALSNKNPIPEMLTNRWNAEYYGDLKANIRLYIKHNPEAIHQVYTNLQPVLRDRSTDLRAYYSSMANWRFWSEDMKAYKDLFVDLIVKSSIIIYDAYTLNWLAIVGHFEKLDKCNKSLDAIYTASTLALELHWYNALWADAMLSFDYANKCIGQGSVTTTQNNDFSLFPAAYAAKTNGITPPTIPTIDKAGLKIQNGALPISQLNEVINGDAGYTCWFEANRQQLLRLSFEDPATVAGFMTSMYDFQRNAQRLEILTIGIASEPRNGELIKQFNTTGALVADASTKLSTSTVEVVKKIDALPANPKLGEFEPTGKKNNKWFLMGGGGLLILLLVTGGIMLFKRRRKTKVINQKTQPQQQQPVIPKLVNVPPVQPARPQQQQQPAPTISKFCVECGNPLKAGARFCEKCGKQL
jgi:hypothetical protein